MAIKLAKKILMVSSWAPPHIGASPHFFYNIFSLINPSDFAFYTNTEKLEGFPIHERLPCTYHSYQPQGHRGRGILSRVMHAIYALRNGARVIRREHVELLMGLSDDGPGLLLTGALSFVSKTPYVLYLFDPYCGGSFDIFKNILATLFEGVLFRHARRIIVTSDGLADAYRRRYGDTIRLEVLHNSLTPEEVPETKAPALTQLDREILYSGNIYWAQERSIRNIIVALDLMKEPDVMLSLYVPKNVEYFKRHFESVRVKVSTANNFDVLALQRQADILLLPLSWSNESRLVIETALPGKMTEYLVAGRPILVHAPPYSHLAHYARENGFALVIDTEDPSAIVGGIRNILEDPSCAERLVQNAKKIFAKNHDAYTNACRLAHIIATC